MNILRRLIAAVGGSNPSKVKIRGKQGKKQIKGGRFARQMTRRWNMAHSTYVPGQLGLSSVSQSMLKDGGGIAPRRERKFRYYNGPTWFRKKGAK